MMILYFYHNLSYIYYYSCYTISMSVNNHNFTSLFLKLLAVLIQEPREILQDLNDKSLTHFSKVFKNISQK